MNTRHLMVIDPGVKTPEIDTFNNIARMSPLPCSYHLPAMFGFDSFPSDIREVSGVIVLGSLASVFDRYPWQAQLESWMRPVIEAGIPVLGCCYGHQMLAWMHGAHIGFVNENQSKLQGVRTVSILDNPLWTAGDCQLIVTHCEMVTSLPAGLKRIASSPEVAIDGFMLENKPVFGFQAHPEATFQFLKDRQLHDAQAVGVLSQGHSLIRSFVHMAAQNRA